ncbi:MAG: 2-hydroxyacid dehydrogenase [Candidatus Dormibacteria bacterium]
MSQRTIWIPATTPRECRELLPTGIDLREVPAIGPISDAPQHADMLINAYDPQRAIEVIPQLRNLDVVQVLSAGVDVIAPHIPSGVTLCDGSGIHDASVAEWVVMATIAMRRGLPDHIRSQLEQSWNFMSGADLEGASVLIVGHGSIGRAVESRLRPFGARIVRVARRARDGVHTIAELPKLLPEADVVVLLVPLTDETRGMVDSNFLNSMREGALLVNAARGPVVDTAALLDALRGEHIRAALDVTDPEPLPDGHPLWSAPGLLITPHIGGAVQQLFTRAWRFAGEQVRRYIDGEPLRNVVSEGY